MCGVFHSWSTRYLDSALWLSKPHAHISLLFYMLLWPSKPRVWVDVFGYSPTTIKSPYMHWCLFHMALLLAGYGPVTIKSSCTHSCIFFLPTPISLAGYGPGAMKIPCMHWCLFHISLLAGWIRPCNYEIIIYTLLSTTQSHWLTIKVPCMCCCFSHSLKVPCLYGCFFFTQPLFFHTAVLLLLAPGLSNPHVFMAILTTTALGLLKSHASIIRLYCWLNFPVHITDSFNVLCTEEITDSRILYLFCTQYIKATLHFLYSVDFHPYLGRGEYFIQGCWCPRQAERQCLYKYTLF